jgi:hypothetical protein
MASVSPGREDGKTSPDRLKAFLASTPGARAGVLAYNGTEALAVGKDLYAIPMSLLLA